MAFIEFRSVIRCYNDYRAVDDFSLAIERGERLVILGHSGCGKTTILRLLAGLAAPDSGSILIGDEIVSAGGRILVEPEKRNLGMVFQDLALWPHLTVKGNLEFGLKARGIPRAERERRIRDVLALMRIEDRMGSRPSELSGGEQQRVALARALVLEPVALLMDEPLSSLHPELNFQLRGEILHLHSRLSFTLFYVTHSREEAFHIGLRILVMEQGRILQIGSPDEIREHLRVK